MVYPYFLSPGCVDDDGGYRVKVVGDQQRVTVMMVDERVYVDVYSVIMPCAIKVTMRVWNVYIDVNLLMKRDWKVSRE